MVKERDQARLRLANVISLDSRRAACAHLHREQVIPGQAVALIAKRPNQGGPVVRRDTATLLPFLNHRSVLANSRGHLRERAPGVKDIVNSAHARECAPDNSSGQGPPMIPMTSLAVVRTIRPMGRASTPVRLRAEMAKRLRSARIVALYATQKQAADALQIGLDRYEKWESGRTPIPAQYIGPICKLYGVDANYLYDIEAKRPARETG